jgi:LacI family transcriptional regulator
MATIYDIAKKAGVSISTVSRVLNNSPSVKEATRKKVEKAIKETNYIPKTQILEAWKPKTTQLVGVLVTDSRSWVYADTIYSIERTLDKHGYGMILYNAGIDNPESLYVMRDLNINYIILVGAVFNDTYQQTNLITSFKNTKFVILNSKLSAENVHAVSINHQQSVKMCYEYMKSKGYDNILLVEDMKTATTQIRKSTFKECCANDGKRCDDLIFDTVRSHAGGYSVAEEILETGIDFDGIIFSDDITAIGAINKFHEVGLKVPDDVGIIGWHNSAFAEISDPPLTSVNMKANLLGSIAAETIVRIKEGQETSSLINIDCELVIRESC